MQLRCHRPGSEPIPNRRLALKILRSMRLGNPLVRGGDSALLTWLDGVPNVIHLFDYLVRNKYVEPLAEHGIASLHYVLTAAGRELHDRGERWWKSLTWKEQLTVVIYG